MLELVKKCLWVVKKKKITKAAKNHSDYYIAYSATTNNSLDTKKSFLLKTCDFLLKTCDNSD